MQGPGANRVIGTARKTSLRAMDPQSFRRAYGDFPQASWVIDCTGFHCLAANARALELLGISEQKFLSQRMADLCSPEDYSRWITLREEQPVPRWLTWERKVRRGDGSWLPLRLHSSSVLWQGRPAELSVVESHCAHHAAAPPGSMEELLENGGAALGRYSVARHRMVYANRPMTALMGIAGALAEDLGFTQPRTAQAQKFSGRAGDLLQRVFVEVEQWAEFLSRAAAGRPFTQKCLWRLPDGSRAHMHLQATPVRTPAGTEVLLYAHDAGPELRAELNARQSQKMEALGRMAGGVAHDFNNLLLILRGHAELLEEALADRADLRAHTSKLISASRQAADITRTLLTFSRQEPHPLVPLELNRTLQAAAEVLPSLLCPGIVLDMELAEQDLAVIALEAHIEQLLLNLSVNARDAMPQGGRLSIRTRYRGPDAQSSNGWAVLEVSDTGIGMDADTRAHIFEPFYTTKSRGRGTGLGLALVYGIVTQYGGTLEVDSAVGQGTTFRLALPVAGAPAAPVPPAAADETPEKGTVLVVDDEPEIRQMVSDFVRRLGHRVLTAGNADEALRVALPVLDQIDVVLTDVVMPVTDGFELALMLRQRKPSLPVIVMSGFTGGAMARRGKQLGNVPLLSKPFSLRQLEASLKAILAEPKTPAKVV